VGQGKEITLKDRILVVGGGNVAVDVALTALRVGAGAVTMACLASRDEMPASPWELEMAVEEGVKLMTSWGPKKILAHDGKVTGAELIQCASVFDEKGDFCPAFNDITEKVEVDQVILAIGQQPDFSFLSDDDGVELTPSGTIKIDATTLATTAPGVYAGGDAAFGPRIAIEAVANGKTAAQSIHGFLSGHKPTTKMVVEIDKIPADEHRMPAGYERSNRTTAPTVDVGRRTGITEVENVMTEEQALAQAERCLSCHIDTIYDPRLCVLCNRCADVCPEKCLIFVPLERVDIPEEQRAAALETYGHDQDQPMTVLLKDDTICIRCGLCALRCPTEAMTMERFNFIEDLESQGD